ncbi:MAG: hypothetical protein KGD63_06600 [Candidatus Lokiarchaeota archaeon]|nr:hypothetical protein [Candidatus Lokiarchaeota archaeon]
MLESIQNSNTPIIVRNDFNIEVGKKPELRSSICFMLKNIYDSLPSGAFIFDGIDFSEEYDKYPIFKYIENPEKKKIKEQAAKLGCEWAK